MSNPPITARTLRPFEQKRRTFAGCSDQRPRNRRSDDARAVHDGRVERNCVHQVVAPDEFDGERLARRILEGGRNSDHQGSNEHMPYLHGIAEDQRRQQQCGRHRRSLGYQQQGALGNAIRQGASGRGENQHWQRLRRRDCAKPEGGIRQA
jgi:hypothetical protein